MKPGINKPSVCLYASFPYPKPGPLIALIWKLEWTNDQGAPQVCAMKATICLN